MKAFSEYMSLKTMEADLEIRFVEHIQNAMMKHAPVRFLCILGIQSIIGSVFSLFFPVFSSINLSQLLLARQ